MSHERTSVGIRIAATARDEEIVLTVTDEGAEVPLESLGQLFDPFFRPDIARTHETGGTGLGLAIVKSCIEACGGRVAVKNLEPRGLEVTIFLRETGNATRWRPTVMR